MIRSRAGRILLTAAVYVVSLAVIAMPLGFAVLVLAGPHGGVLPGGIRPVVLPLAWLIALLAPAWPALAIWRRLERAVKRASASGKIPTAT